MSIRMTGLALAMLASVAPLLAQSTTGEEIGPEVNRRRGQFVYQNVTSAPVTVVVEEIRNGRTGEPHTYSVHVDAHSTRSDDGGFTSGQLGSYIMRIKVDGLPKEEWFSTSDMKDSEGKPKRGWVNRPWHFLIYQTSPTRFVVETFTMQRAEACGLLR